MICDKRAMLRRFISLAGIIAVGSIGIANIAGRQRAEGPAAPAPDPYAGESNWTMRGRDAAAASAKAAASRPSEVRIRRASDSHFYADTDVQGTQIHMLVDSGASLVALTRRDAEAIGIDVDRLPVAGMAQTAGGPIPMRVTMLDSVDVDGITVRNVEAAVVDADMGVSLLGQSFLAKLDTVNIEGDTMTLR
ncbi:MAG TPA: TIGR02281 family clan AA aspartic protease [Sphingopyxis sp.]|uniref:retropepsin-like aspartic protease family protein n=1 Tax=Sphingopyxis sp. TaxID=1908224 RepID=UPI002E314893|nr:TIGR02281 family clan AA aspartic protease [Sphingopyxis sp.]HEX2812837.1 TIGR02281 family clan AA aspartic protease [Sphingopyxis sp.]